MQMRQHRQEMHRLRVLDAVQELGNNTTVVNNSEVPPWALCSWRHTAGLIPACLGVNIIVCKGNIDKQGRGEVGAGLRRGPRDLRGGGQWEGFHGEGF